MFKGICFSLNEVKIITMALNALGQRAEYELKKNPNNPVIKETLSKVEEMLEKLEK